jgi:hypothetical protein
MPSLKPIALIFIAALIVAGLSVAKPLDKVLGTWRMVSARIDPDGRSPPAYGPAANSLLVFTADNHVIEGLTDSTIPEFASDARGHGTAEENQTAMAGSIGWFGTYTVDENGELSGDRVEGSTFLIGSVTSARARNFISSWTAIACRRTSKGRKGPRSSSPGSACAEAGPRAEPHLAVHAAIVATFNPKTELERFPAGLNRSGFPKSVKSDS